MTTSTWKIIQHRTANKRKIFNKISNELKLWLYFYSISILFTVNSLSVFGTPAIITAIGKFKDFSQKIYISQIDYQLQTSITIQLACLWPPSHDCRGWLGDRHTNGEWWIANIKVWDYFFCFSDQRIQVACTSSNTNMQPSQMRFCLQCQTQDVLCLVDC